MEVVSRASWGEMKSGWCSWGSSSRLMAGTGLGLGDFAAADFFAGAAALGAGADLRGSSWLEFQTWSWAAAIWSIERPVTEELGR